MHRFSVAQFLMSCLTAMLVCRAASGAEPAREFLDGLRDRGYYDVALDYIAAAQDNPRVPTDFKLALVYERGATLVKAARVERDPKLRDRGLAAGEKELNDFLKAQPYHVLVIAARTELAHLQIDRARAFVERAKRAGSEAQPKLLAEARKLYAQGIEAFTALDKELAEKLKAYSIALDPKRDAKRHAERDQYRRDELSAKLLTAAAVEEQADAMPASSTEHAESLSRAAELYAKIGQRYRTRIAGSFAQVAQARCLQKLGKHQEALAILNVLLETPDTEQALHELRVAAMLTAAPSWIALKFHREVQEQALPLIEGARATEDRSDNFMQLRLLVADSCRQLAEELLAKNPNDAQARRVLSTGRKLASYASKFPSKHQEAARALLREFPGAGRADDEDQPEPKTFAEAQLAGKRALEAREAASLILRNVPQQLQMAKTPAERADLEQTIASAKLRLSESQAAGLKYFRQALTLAGAGANIDDVNNVRYLLCFLLYADQDYLDAAVVGEFTARTYPGSAGARQCAKIALASQLQLYAIDASEDKSVATQQIVGLATYMLQQWPEQIEAQEALNTLIPFMIRAKQLDQAQAYLDRIPADSAQRGAAELTMGQALWASYCENAELLRQWKNGDLPTPESIDLAAREAELATLKTRARDTLAAGVARMRTGGELSPVLTTAMLSLAQIHLDTGEAGQAIVLLEDPKFGPLVLVRQGNPLAARDAFREETYKTALRAYVSSLGTAADVNAVVQNARGVMDALKQQVGNTPAGQQRLINVYIGLARDVQQQMQLADDAAKASLGKCFESFLSEVAKDATQLDVLNWAAETYRGMGESFGPQSSGAEQAHDYLQRAEQTYRRILELGESQPGYLKPSFAMQIELQLARTLRGLNDFDAALAIYEQLLLKHSGLLPIQIEAAHTLQEQGASLTGEPAQQSYRQAMFGGQPDPARPGREAIWGWTRIAAAAGNDYEKHGAVLHEARYNLAFCRYNLSKPLSGVEQADLLRAARREILATFVVYPEMGGPKQRALFDNLLRSVQESLGERALGLAALQIEINSRRKAEEKRGALPASTSTTTINSSEER